MRERKKKPNPQTPADKGSAASLGAVATFVRAMATTLTVLGLAPLGDAARTKMKPRWRSHVPALARAVAEMLAADPSFFSWVPFTAAQLLRGTRFVAALVQARQKIEEFTAIFDDALIEGKSTLFDQTTQVVDGLYRLLDSPELTGTRRERLLQISAEVRTIAEAQRAQVATALRNSRDKNERLAQAEGSIEQLTAENQTLRAEVDGAEPASQAVAARRSTRRTRR